MEKGFIYKIISPSNKAYIGQVIEYLRNWKKKGIRGRWLQLYSNIIYIHGKKKIY